MANYYQMSVSYDKVQENGTEKKVTERYLVNALSLIEASSRFQEYIEPFISGEFEISEGKKYKVAEIFKSQKADADRYYRFKVLFITLDEKTGQEKATANFYLVHAESFHDAVRVFDEEMKQCYADFVISSVAETPIMDIVEVTL